MNAVAGARVVVLGATSLVGTPLLGQLVQAGYEVLAVSRTTQANSTEAVQWVKPECLCDPNAAATHQRFDHCPWISLAPVWVLADALAGDLALKPSRIIALSSTSRFSKEDSAVPAERALANRLAAAEALIISQADAAGLPWLILRPTLIHGFGRDRNVADIARFVRRYGLFPILGQGRGMRRPIHAREVAFACLQALRLDLPARLALTLSGAEVLSYKSMVLRVFETQGLRPRLIHIPRGCLRFALGGLHALGVARAWSIGMADRMDQDLDYPGEEASRLLALEPGDFRPDPLP